MAYSTYDFYTSTFKGAKVSEADYIYLSERAGDFIDNHTYKPIVPEDEAVKKCECALVEILYDCGADSKEVVSENLADASVNYLVSQTTKQKMYSTVRAYLFKKGYISCII